MYKSTDLKKFEAFAKNIQYGDMAKYNARTRWGLRGKLILARKINKAELNKRK